MYLRQKNIQVGKLTTNLYSPPLECCHLSNALEHFTYFIKIFTLITKNMQKALTIFSYRPSSVTHTNNKIKYAVTKNDQIYAGCHQQG